MLVWCPVISVDVDFFIADPIITDVSLQLETSVLMLLIVQIYDTCGNLVVVQPNVCVYVIML